MAPRSSRNLKTKEVKIPHLIVANRKKMETWGLGGLFAADWNGTYDNLVEELSERKVSVPKYEYRGKPEEWSADVWREVYNLPKASLGGYTMKEKFSSLNFSLEAMAQNMKEMFAPPPVVEADIQPWKKMVKNLANLLTEEQKRNKTIIEQSDYFKGKTRHLEKIQR
ncbi:hypothetical protein R1flu_002789 [Riccia fluitans]|uniref:Transposase n=1 Tax=Riccia fluitans TaxID=41844 RepID=A0ABD1Y832_9MARC